MFFAVHKYNLVANHSLLIRVIPTLRLTTKIARTGTPCSATLTAARRGAHELETQGTRNEVRWHPAPRRPIWNPWVSCFVLDGLFVATARASLGATKRHARGPRTRRRVDCWRRVAEFVCAFADRWTSCSLLLAAVMYDSVDVAARTGPPPSSTLAAAGRAVARHVPIVCLRVHAYRCAPRS